MRPFLLAVLFSFFYTSASAIEIIAPHAPGGPSDLMARTVYAELPQDDYSVIYKPGAASLIGIRHTLESRSMLMATFVQTFVTLPLNNKLDFDPVKELEVVALLGAMPSVLLCHSKLGFNTFDDFSKTDKTLVFGIAGFGSNENIASETLFKVIGKRHNLVPYNKGGTRSITDLAGGHIDCIFANYPTAIRAFDNPNISVLVSTHKMKDTIPSWKELKGEEFPYQSYTGIAISKRLDEATKQKIKKDISAISRKSISERLKTIGLLPMFGTDQASIESVYQNNDFLLKFIKDNNIKLSK